MAPHCDATRCCLSDKNTCDVSGRDHLVAGCQNLSLTGQKNYGSFYHQCQIKEMIGEADKDDSGSVDFGERNVFHLALLLVCLSEKLLQHFCNNIH